MKLSDKKHTTPPRQTQALSICVYCGALPGHNPAYVQTAQQVGQWLGQQGARLVYGGGSTGLMGEIARATLAAGGTVTGIIPKVLVEQEFALADCTELHVVDDMHQRKQSMAEHADAFLTLPGGLGTLEEFFEIWTWRYLEYHHKPIGLLNINGYYDYLLQFLSASHQQGFIRAAQMQMLLHSSDATAVLEALRHAVAVQG